jgi:anti-sigma-K factor RskA
MTMASSAEYEGYDDLVQLGRALSQEDHQRFAPPPDLWDRIANEVSTDAPALAVAELDGRRARRHRRFTATLAAAAAVIVVVGFAVLRQGDNTRTITEVALSNLGLDPTSASSTGRARVVEFSNGSRAIELDVSSLPKVDGGFFELWLLDPQAKGMVSMGPVTGDGRFTIPAGLATSAFPIVDLSIEPLDGVPTHSGVSILRGALS